MACCIIRLYQLIYRLDGGVRSRHMHTLLDLALLINHVIVTLGILHNHITIHILLCWYSHHYVNIMMINYYKNLTLIQCCFISQWGVSSLKIMRSHAEL